MNDAIDLSTASPTEYLRWLQLRAAREPSALGSWMLLSASESLRDRDALEASLERITNDLRNSLVNIEEAELNDWERALLEKKKELLDMQRPTEIGNQAYHSTLTDLIGVVSQAADRLGYNVPEAVTFGVLPTGRVNGLACPVPAGGLIIAIDDGLFNFVYGLAKAIATFYRVTSMADGWNFSLVDSDIPSAVRTNDEANIRWTETLVATFVYGYPNCASFRPLLDNRSYLVDQLVTPIELFIVAHEYGHLILGHYEQNRRTSEWSMAGGVNVDEFETGRAEELEADRIGLELLREHHRSMGLTVENTRWVICFLAGCLNILEEMLGEWPTHPSASTRTERLLEQLAREDGATNIAASFGAGIYRVMGELRFHNAARYEEWKVRALNGEDPWPNS